MIIKYVSVPVLIIKSENHGTLKQKILCDIESMGTHDLIKTHTQTNIWNTDWHLKSDYPRPYVETIKPLLEKVVYDIKKNLHLKDDEQVGVTNCWFQQYMKGDNHDYHYHLGSFYNCVYYVELPENGSKTTFRINGKEIEFDIVEGDILCFPGTIEHCSKPNMSNKRKTIVAFNTTLPKQLD